MVREVIKYQEVKKKMIQDLQKKDKSLLMMLEISSKSK